jgi:dihydroxyacetone kinase, phosphoprotein-dependent, L subunit
MATTLSRDEVAAIMGGVAKAMIASKDELTVLDAELGDGDLGRTIERGFNGIIQALSAELPPDVGRLLFQLGKSFGNAAPSSFGALYSTALMKAGMALKDKTIVTLSEVTDATETALNALIERGKAQIGNKTMLDAIHPALQAMRTTLAEQGDAVSVLAFLQAAALAAQAGAEKTQAMQSQIGRASWQGERSAGKMDPGAHAIALMFAAAVAYLQSQQAK